MTRKNVIFGAIWHACAHARYTYRYMTPVVHNKQKGLSQKILRFTPYFLSILLWAALTFKEQYFLRKVQDLSLFLFDGNFLSEGLKTPGGALSLAGSFLTQFLYYPWIGSLIWILLLFATARLTLKAFNIPDRYSALSFIPAAILVISNLSLGYGLYIMRTPDHFFGPTLGYLLAVTPVLIVKKLSSRQGLQAAFLIIWTCLVYPLAGIYSIAGTLAAGTTILKTNRIPAAISAAVASIIPLVYYNFYTSFRLANAWTIGLPVVSDEAWTAQICTPYYILLALAVIAPLLSGLLNKNNDNKPYAFTIQAVTASILVILVLGFWFRDDNFHTELAMSEAVDNYDWQKTVDIFKQATQSHSGSDAKAYEARTRKLSQAKSNDEILDITDQFESRFYEPTRTMVLYRDLALLKLNKALDMAFTMKDGGRAQKSRTQIPMVYQAARQLYFQYGVENMCYRWCMEDIVEHGWSYNTLRYMAEYAIVTKENNMAGKYLDKLSKTLFYRKWAQSRKRLIQDNSLINTTEPYKSIVPYMCYDNNMSNDMAKPEIHLINHFLSSQSAQATPEFDRAALLFAMRTQDITSFRQRLVFYLRSNNPDKLPRGVQEAAILYGDLQKDPIGLPYDKTVKDSYESFKKYVNSHSIRSIKESAYPYYLQFGKTFYYFYYFIRNLQTY